MEDVSHGSVDAEPIVRWEAAVGGSLADDTVGARGVAGGLGRVGFRWVDGAEGQHQETYARIAAHVGRAVREVVVGDYLGADVRARTLFDLSGAHRDPRYLIGGAAAFASSSFVEATGLPRGRYARRSSVFGSM